jgi:CRP-like cAMP-binding protein
MRLLFLLFPICRRATDIGMETRTYRRDPRKGFGPGDQRPNVHRFQQPQPEPIIAKVSQETLAEMIGTTRPRVSFFMNRFRKLGLIDYNGSIEIHSSFLNVVLRDQPQNRP